VESKKRQNPRTRSPARLPGLKFDTSAVPGRFFEMPDHFRIGMGVNTEMFAEGLKRIARSLAR